MEPNGDRDLDVRTLPPSEKYPTVLGIFDDLEVGQSIVIVEDHDPLPLRNRFEAERPGEADWTYLEQGRDGWRVRLERIREPMT